MLRCPLCDTHNIRPVNTTDARTYFTCETCMLIFVAREFHPSLAKAAERYRRHENSKHDDGYISFLMQAITPALPFLTTQMIGLDYGCGPVPALSDQMKDRGFSCENYDPIFFPALPDKLYDFIFSTECFEHFISPKSDITKVLSLLKPGGLLVVMTDTWTSLGGFNQWYYTRDFTHVSFFHKNTFDYICKTFDLTLLSNTGTRVFVMRKNVKSSSSSSSSLLHSYSLIL